jgi:Tfp pilus assembly protein FimV
VAAGATGKEAAFHLGEHLAETGDIDRAMELMERAVATGDPASAPQAADLLTRLRSRP